jgi:uncharacterized protein (TIGR02270 family)
MSVSSRRFRLDLYREHLEELAFLYEQCRYLRDDPLTPWARLDDFEQRLEAHLDALHIGGRFSLQVSSELAESADAAEVFAASAVFCRQESVPMLSAMLRSASLQDPDCRRALRDALAHELPHTWQPHCLRALSSGAVLVRPVLAHALAYRRVPCPGVAEALLKHADEADLPGLLWAVGRWGDSADLHVVRLLYAHSQPAIRDAAIRSGLRLADPVASGALSRSSPEPVGAVLYGLAGARDLASPLVKQLAERDCTPDVVRALGLLGDLSAVRPLVLRLDHERLGSYAAQALSVITGARIYDKAFVAEHVMEDELFDDELRQYRETGALPKRADGRPFGSEVSALSRDTEKWEAWLLQHSTRFRSGVRYRFGKPCSPAITMLGLSAETTPNDYRNLFVDELMMRYRIDVALETDMPVAKQRTLLHHALRLVVARTTSFEPGLWYSAGAQVR